MVKKRVFNIILILLFASPVWALDSLTQFDITWTFDKDITTNGAGDTYQYGQFVNGDYWIVEATEGGDVTINTIDPCSVNIGGRIKHGSQLSSDIKDFTTLIAQQTMTQGFDNNMTTGATFTYAAAKNVAFEVDAESPLAIPAGTALLSSISNVAIMRPQLKGMSILTVLASAPAADSFRPAYAGDNKTIEWNKSDISYTSLGSVDLSGISSPVFPSLATCEGYFERPWPDWKGNSDGGRNLHPSDNMPHYGQDIAQRVGVAAIMLNSDETDEAKETLMIRFLQYGIDLWGVYEANINWAWWMDGGHGPGRKFPILFAGTILGDPCMAAIGTHDLDDPIFGEDHSVYYLTQAECNRYMTGGDTWAEGGRYTEYQGDQNVNRLDEDAYYVAEDWDYVNPNGEVGIPEYIKMGVSGSVYNCCQGRSISRRYDASYRAEQHGSSMTGFLLAAHIMGLKDEWNHDALFDYIDRWMDSDNWNITGDPPTWAVYEDNWGHPINWHRTGAWMGLGHANMHAWDLYRADYPPVWPEGGDPNDEDPPEPDPMTWASVPAAANDTSISMTATTATDASGVLYFFDETSKNAGGSDSSWQSSASYLDTGLSPETEYTYTVQARDKSDGQNTGTASDPCSATTEAEPAAGDPCLLISDDTMYSFDGLDDYVEVSTTSWSIGEGTIALWFNSNDFSGTRYCFGHNIGTSSWSNRIQLYFEYDGDPYLGLGDTHALDNNSTNLSLGTWYHIVLTWNDDDYVVYLDGAELLSGTFSRLLAFDTTADIGNTGNSSFRDEEVFSGYITHIRIYDDTLSGVAVLALYNAWTPRTISRYSFPSRKYERSRYR